MTSENDIANPPPAFASAAREVTVPASRLSWGEFDHANQRESGVGDINASYSADKIPEGKIRRPFKFEGSLWITVSLSGLHGLDEASAYRIVQEKSFPRPTTTYAIKTRQGDECRADSNGFYDAMAIACGSERYVLAGPPVRFVAEREPSPPEPSQLSLFGEAAP